LDSAEQNDTIDIKVDTRQSRKKLPNMAITSIAFSSEGGSELRGWEHLQNQ